MTDQQSHQKTACQPHIAALVGHCGPDSWMLESVVRRALGASTVILKCHDDASTMAAVLSADVLLVNRVLDGDFSADGGIELIGQMLQTPDRRATCMLISNFQDSQAEAERTGAVPGFGKSTAGSAETARRLQDAAARARATLDHEQ